MFKFLLTTFPTHTLYSFTHWFYQWRGTHVFGDLFPHTQQATKVARGSSLLFSFFNKERTEYDSFSFMAFNRRSHISEFQIPFTGIIELISIHEIYTFYIWIILDIFMWMDYNSFPFMAFTCNRSPLVDFRYPLLVLLSWFPFMGFIHFTSRLYCIYIYTWMDYNSFPFMAFNREPLVHFKYPSLVLLSWFPFMLINKSTLKKVLYINGN